MPMLSPIRVEMADGGIGWIVTDRSQARACLTNSDLSSRHGNTMADIGGTISGSLLYDDGHEHAMVRALLGRTLGKQTDTVAACVLERAAAILARVPSDKLFDAVEVLVDPVLHQALSSLFGVPDELSGEIDALTRDMFLRPRGDPAAMAAATRLGAIAWQAITSNECSDGFFGQLRAAHYAEELSRSAVIANAVTVVAASAQTSRMAMAALLDHIAREDEIPEVPAVATHVMRTAVRDTVALGKQIAAGERVIIDLPACSSPPGVKHLAFGAGRHACFGAPIALGELRALRQALVADGRRLEAAGAATIVESLLLRGPATVPVILRAA